MPKKNIRQAEQECKQKLRDMLTSNNMDSEIQHEKADSILVDFIRELGYDEIANLYEDVDKWYA